MTERINFSPLDTHFADFIVRIDSHPCNELWWSAALASYSTGSGHTCFNLFDPCHLSVPQFLEAQKGLPPLNINFWRGSLSLCDTVGAPGDYTPLVLDSAGRLYLQRCWKYEQQVADNILSRCCPLETDEIMLDVTLNRYLPTDDLQRSAARMALTHRFSVISGGPGTGKTATVARILALLLDMAGDSPPIIKLAAPTGKAALRLQQSLINAAELLALPDEIKKNLPDSVSTIHRLLGVNIRKGGFRHNRSSRLTCDILVVDEASMVDLQLMASLLEALPDDARVILLGDRNQLASVEAGALLADICDSAPKAPIPVTQLTKSYRFGNNSGIAALSQLINSGDSTAAVNILKSGQFSDILWRSLPVGAQFENDLSAAIQDGYAGFAKATSPLEALLELGSFRILSPLRLGECGVERLNRLCLSSLAPKQKTDHQNPFPKPIMITGNDYELGLFNGDAGVLMSGNETQSVWFEKPEGGIRHISMLRLPPCETAFAMTVHKSQGGEFNRVLLILPDSQSEILSRELLYTAITRARHHIEIWCSEKVFCQAVERQTIRRSGLVDRLTAGEENRPFISPS